MADPQTLADPQLMRRVGRRYAELGRVKAAADRLSSASGDLEAARELAAEDRSFADEISPPSRKRKRLPTRRS